MACRQPTHNTEQCSLSSRKSIETTIISGSWSDFEIFSFTTMPNRFQIHGLLRHEILHGQSLGNALASHGPATPGSHWFQMCLSKAHQVLCLCTLYSISTCLYIIYSIINIYIYMYRIMIEYYRSLVCTYIYIFYNHTALGPTVRLSISGSICS